MTYASVPFIKPTFGSFGLDEKFVKIKKKNHETEAWLTLKKV